MLLLIVLLSRLTSAVKASIESALMPVPLCLAACLIVLHMFPGSMCSCMGGIGGAWCLCGTGSE